MADGNTDEEFDFLSTLKILLGIKDEKLNDILLIYLSLTKEKILNYCNVSELPSALNFTLCQMTADIYREQNAINNNGQVVGNVSSISEDGRSVSFAGIDSIKASIEDKISRTTELNHYRKLFRI